MRQFFKEQLSLARDLRSISQRDLASQIKITQGTLSKIENGQMEPAPTLVELIARELSLPAQFFYEATLQESSSSSLLFRKRASLSKSKLTPVSAQITVIHSHIKRMLAAFDLDDIPIRELSRKNWEVDPTQVAQKCKSLLGVSDGPVPNMTSIVERAGIVVVPTNFPTNEIDGVYVHDEHFLPIIIMNARIPGDRWRWTLAHEFGHAVMHMNPASDSKEYKVVEEEANVFASEFLMPASDIKGSLAVALDLRKLTGLKLHWRVSIQALVMRAYALGCISEHQKRRFFTKMNELRIRTDEPGKFLREHPVLIERLFEQYMSEETLSFESLCNNLTVSMTDFKSFYPGILRQKPQLVLFE